MSSDTFGRRRDANNWTFKLPFNLAGPITDHGFGDHETRDELGLIHMSGRTYDPDLGQMMQADAIVQSPLNGQNYNRYSYVFNNPMSYTDPTGFMAEASFALPRITVTSSFRGLGDIGTVGFTRSIMVPNLNGSAMPGVSMVSLIDSTIMNDEFFSIDRLYASNSEKVSEDDIDRFFDLIKDVRGIIRIKNQLDDLTIEEFNILFPDMRVLEEDVDGLVFNKEIVRHELIHTALPLLREATKSGNRYVLKKQITAALGAPSSTLNGAIIKAFSRVVVGAYAADQVSDVVSSVIKIRDTVDKFDLGGETLSELANSINDNVEISEYFNSLE